MAAAVASPLNLYHCTSLQAAKDIERCGFGAHRARGLHFATSVTHAQRTADAYGAVMQCRVDLGKVFQAETGQKHFDISDLKSKGFNSARIPGPQPGDDQYTFPPIPHTPIIRIILMWL